jgi:Holliday junction resolvase RusA-like endonuclease
MTRTHAAFQVVGVEPAPQGSKRYLGNGRFVESSKKLEPWRQAVAHAVKEMQKQTDESMFTEACMVTVDFYLPKPKTVKRELPTVAPDLDKLQRSLGDAISLPKYSQLVQDDSLIVKWISRKLYSTPDNMGCTVNIELI